MGTEQETTTMVAHDAGGYAYLPGLRFASGGIVARPGMAFERAVLPRAVALPDGYDTIRRHLERTGRSLEALCGIELRLPAALSVPDFRAFNEEYLAQLDRWGLLRDDASPLARTNVSPTIGSPSIVSVAAFSYTTEAQTALPSFVISGVAELATGATYPEDVVRYGETSLDALLEKARFVADDVGARIRALGTSWDASASVHLYCSHPVVFEIARDVLGPAGVVPTDGVVWHDTAPPVIGLELEVDVRRYAREVVAEA